MNTHDKCTSVHFQKRKRKKKEAPDTKITFFFTEKNNRAVAWDTNKPEVRKYNRLGRIRKQEHNAIKINTGKIHSISIYVADINKAKEKREIFFEQLQGFVSSEIMQKYSSWASLIQEFKTLQHHATI